jgi:hypothetical protein
VDNLFGFMMRNVPILNDGKEPFYLDILTEEKLNYSYGSTLLNSQLPPSTRQFGTEMEFFPRKPVSR